MSIELIYISNNPDVALIAEKNGVDYVMVDLEVLGKEERQKNMDSVKSHHSIKDVEAISEVLTKSKLLVRINPINPCSRQEIDDVIRAGADVIMLPMWRTVEEVKTFTSFVGGRAETMLLLETKETAESIDEVLATGGFDEIHIGLNDLHLSYGLDFMFELLSNGVVEKLCKKMNRAGIKYGFGGIARLGDGMLPAEKIVMEHYRLGSSRAILSRSFCNTAVVTDVAEIENIFEVNIAKLRLFENLIVEKSEADYLENKRSVQQCVQQIVEIIKKRKSQ